MKELLTIRHLRHSFSQQPVLNDVSLSVVAGKITGLIGPSGAGKTTLIKAALGMEKADSGTAKVLDTKMPNRKILGQIGYMAQSDALYQDLTARENLTFFGQMKGINHQELPAVIQKVAQVVDLTADLDKQVKNFSGGMKRRLTLTIALMGNPKLLILDEPTVGIDPKLSRQIWQELRQRRDMGCGILVTTHVMSEAELTDEVALLMNGTIIANDSPAKLKEQYHAKSIEEVFIKAESEVEAN